jgi:hypothetical protein
MATFFVSEVILLISFSDGSEHPSFAFTQHSIVTNASCVTRPTGTDTCRLAQRALSPVVHWNIAYGTSKAL